MSNSKFVGVGKATIVGAFCLGIGLTGCATVGGGTSPSGTAGQANGADVAEQVNNTVDTVNRAKDTANRVYWTIERMKRPGW